MSQSPISSAHLPPLLRATVDQVVRLTGAPPALVVCAALGALSVAAQANARVVRPGLDPSPIGLFVLLAAESGERKSTVDALFTRDLRELERTWSATRDTDAERRAKQLAWDEQVKGLRSAIRRAGVSKPDSVSSLTSRLEQLLRDHPAPLVRPRLFFDDISSRALLAALQSWPAGGVFSPEGVRHLKGQTMKDLETLCLLWSGEMARVERSRSPLIETYDASLTISIMVQPKAFIEFCRDERLMARESGFLSRCLVAAPESTRGFRQVEAVSSASSPLSEFQAKLLTLADRGRSVLGGACAVRHLTMSEDAADCFVNFLNSVEFQMGPSNTYAGIRDWASKAGEHAARLAGLFHILESDADEIRASTMQLAINCTREFLEEHFRLFGNLGELTEDRIDAEKLAAWFLAKLTPPVRRYTWTLSELRQHCPSHMRNKANGRLDRALDLLVQHGTIIAHALANNTLVYYHPQAHWAAVTEAGYKNIALTKNKKFNKDTPLSVPPASSSQAAPIAPLLSPTPSIFDNPPSQDSGYL